MPCQKLDPFSVNNDEVERHILAADTGKLRDPGNPRPQLGRSLATEQDPQSHAPSGSGRESPVQDGTLGESRLGAACEDDDLTFPARDETRSLRSECFDFRWYSSYAM
jgi:hypothetical protein